MPHRLYYDQTSGAAAYNLSWNPPFNAVQFDVDYYEVVVGGLNRSTRDTHLIFFIESKNNATVNISVSVVDRCKRRASATTSYAPSMITSDSTAPAGNQAC